MSFYISLIPFYTVLLDNTFGIDINLFINQRNPHIDIELKQRDKERQELGVNHTNIAITIFGKLNVQMLGGINNLCLCLDRDVNSLKVELDVTRNYNIPHIRYFLNFMTHTFCYCYVTYKKLTYFRRNLIST